MKMNQYCKKSLSRQVVTLMSACIILFIVGTGILFYVLQSINAEYIQKRHSIVEKELLIDNIYEQFNNVFLDARGYIAFGNETYKEKVLNSEDEIRKEISVFKKLANSKDDKRIYEELDEFTDYYFKDVIPSFFNSELSGDRTQMKQIDNSEITAQLVEFRSDIRSYSSLLSEKLDKSVNALSKEQSILQGAFIGFVLLFLLVLQYIVRSIIKNIGKPLADFSFAANEIAAGREAVISVDERREDELGVLSIAFRKMISSVQEKEQELMAHNEELLAQQDELQAQQNELQESLGLITENEQQLTRRNKLINGISTSLDKDEVLKSIVLNMSSLIYADRGIIMLVQEDSYSSFGISEYGVQQFRNNSGLNQRLLEDKKPFTVKREQEASEKGYHENVNYSYDLFLPVLTAFQEVDAIMVFSRYGTPFTEEEMAECEILAKQIATSLDKIKLYEQTEDNRRLNQDILSTIQEGIQLIDQDRKIIQVNQQFCDIFKPGSTPEEIIGSSWDKWSEGMVNQIAEEDFSHSLEVAMKKADEQADYEDRTFTFQKKETNQVLKVYFETLNYGEEALGTILVYRDITKEYEVDQMKSEFVSTVSHELRTPLASVLGFTELMLNKPLKPERQTKYLQTIYNEAKRLTALINDFLDVQRMESGKQTYEKKYLEILPLIQKVIEHLEISTSLHEIRLQVETDDLLILGDRTKIEQAFMNLLSNSIKYSPDGGLILIRLYNNEDLLCIDIQDEGLGIPQESLQHLFQKFYRVDNSDRRRIGGTGLGLSIVEEIIKSHGGRITVTSEYGQGSTFTLSFPKVTLKEERLKYESSSKKLSYDIMVIEDDFNLAELLKYELVDSGFQVSYFKSGRKALQKLKQSPPDAIVLDILLEEGEMDGWTIMKELKEGPELKDIPVFVSTALDEREKGFSLGAKEYLVKPYKPSQLSKVIMHTLLSNGKQGQIMVPRQSFEGDNTLEK